MSSLYEEISLFLYKEASLLDNRQFEEWLNLFDEHVVYRMPVRITREASDTSSSIVNDMAYFEEDRQSLKTRVERLHTTSAWSENPPSRTRHLVTNIVVHSESESDTVKVNSSFLLLRNRNDNPGSDLIFGERQDVLKKVDSNWKIVNRTVYLDQSVLGTLNLAVFV